MRAFNLIRLQSSAARFACLAATAFIVLACERGVADTSASTQAQQEGDRVADEDAGNPVGESSGAPLPVVDDPTPESEPPSFGFDLSTITTACNPDGEEVLFEANNLVPGARFVGFGGDSVLLEGAEDTVPRWHLLQMSLIEPDNFSVSPIVWPDAEGELQMRDVWETFVLACDDAGCLVLELLSDGTFRPLAGGRTPQDVVALVGASVSFGADGGLRTEICVYGAGLYCYEDGTLVQAIDSSELLRDVKLESYGAHYAVSDAGKLWARENWDEAWHELALQSAGEPLIAVDASPLHLSVLGEHGAWYLATQSCFPWCSEVAPEAPTLFRHIQQDPPLVATALIFGFTAQYWATLDKNGTFVFPPFGEAPGCVAGPFTQVLGLYQHACGSSLASLLVTELDILHVRGLLGCASVR